MFWNSCSQLFLRLPDVRSITILTLYFIYHVIVWVNSILYVLTVTKFWIWIGLHCLSKIIINYNTVEPCKRICSFIETNIFLTGITWCFVQCAGNVIVIDRTWFNRYKLAGNCRTKFTWIGVKQTRVNIVNICR